MSTPHGWRQHELPTSCSALATERNDPLAGTAFSEPRVLFVEQPGPWGHSGLTDSHFDADVAVALQKKAAQAGVKVLAIRQPGRTPAGQLRQWLLADTRGARSLVGASYTADAELLALDFDNPDGEPVTEPTYFVCAHSKRDVCCALRGRAVAQVLDDLRPGRVYECAHTGGHRFAANVLVAPLGVLYGRIDVPDVDRLIAAVDEGAVLPEFLRGRLGMTPVAQAALAFGYAELGITDPDALAVVAEQELADGIAEVTLRAASGEYAVTVRYGSEAAFGISCAKPWPDTIEAYRPSGLRPEVRTSPAPG